MGRRRAQTPGLSPASSWTSAHLCLSDTNAEKRPQAGAAVYPLSGNLIRTEVSLHSSTTCYRFRTCKALRARCCFLQISAPVGVLTECATEGGLRYTTHANNRDCPHPQLCHLAIHGRLKPKFKNARPDCNTAPTLGKFASSGEAKAAKQEGRRREGLSMLQKMFKTFSCEGSFC